MKAASRKPKAGQPKALRLNSRIFCCGLGPRHRGTGPRVQCVGRKGHLGNCRATEFGEWDRANPEVWLGKVATHHD